MQMLPECTILLVKSQKFCASRIFANHRAFVFIAHLGSSRHSVSENTFHSCLSSDYNYQLSLSLSLSIYIYIYIYYQHLITAVRQCDFLDPLTMVGGADQIAY